MFEPVEYTLRLIDGDYALLVTDEGLENRVARALLPPEADEGDRLRFEDLSYTVL
jgi:hypothetical protein